MYVFGYLQSRERLRPTSTRLPAALPRPDAVTDLDNSTVTHCLFVSSAPCGAAVGQENITTHTAGRSCQKGDADWECWHDSVARKTGGLWYQHSYHPRTTLVLSYHPRTTTTF